MRDNYYDFPSLQPQPQTTATPSSQATTTPPPMTTHINWVSHLYKTMTADYVPQELFKGLVVCGKVYAMYAIDASDALRQTLHVDYSSVPGLGFGNYHTLELQWLES